MHQESKKSTLKTHDIVYRITAENSRVSYQEGNLVQSRTVTQILALILKIYLSHMKLSWSSVKHSSVVDSW